MPHEGPIDLLVDSTGLKVCGQSEWHSQKHGEKKARHWKKLHIGVDARGRIVASKVTESHEQDPSQVPELLSQVDGVIDRFIGDSIFDQAPVYIAVENHSPGARGVIRPRKDAVLSSMARTAPTQRDQHVLTIESEGGSAWKRTSGYYAQSQAGTLFRDSNGYLEAGCGRSGMSARSVKPPWLASCSIRCRHWVVLNPVRLAESGVHGTSLPASRFVQQIPPQAAFDSGDDRHHVIRWNVRYATRWMIRMTGVMWVICKMCLSLWSTSGILGHGCMAQYSAGKGERTMLPDERHVTVEDAARQIRVQPITLRRWLGILPMPRFEYEGTEYVLQADVDAFNEACSCKNMRWTYEELKAVKTGVA